MKSAMLRTKPDMVLPLFISVVLTLYAFYVDEGKHKLMEF